MYHERALDNMADAHPSRNVMTSSDRTLDADTTIDLLRRVQLGDDDARDRLLERLLPPLRRWAHGRLSGPLRGAHETSDLVQETALKVLPKLDGFESGIRVRCRHTSAGP